MNGWNAKLTCCGKWLGTEHAVRNGCTIDPTKYKGKMRSRQSKMKTKKKNIWKRKSEKKKEREREREKGTQKKCSHHPNKSMAVSNETPKKAVIQFNNIIAKMWFVHMLNFTWVFPWFHQKQSIYSKYYYNNGKQCDMIASVRNGPKGAAHFCAESWTFLCA